MGREYPDAIDMFVPTERVFSGAKPRGAVVEHKTAGFNTAQECGRYFGGPDNSDWVSSHFIVGLDGTVVQCVSLNDGAGANCCLLGAYDPYWNKYNGVNLNLVTVSIEHVDNHRGPDGKFDNQGVCPPAQLEASFKLNQWLRDNYGFRDFKTHASIDPINRNRCPGNYPMDKLVAAMASREVPSAKDKALHDQWRANIKDLRTDTGIYRAWATLKSNGKRLNAPTSQEYPSVNDENIPIIRQDGGNWYVEWYPKGRPGKSNFDLFTL